MAGIAMAGGLYEGSGLLSLVCRVWRQLSSLCSPVNSLGISPDNFGAIVKSTTSLLSLGSRMLEDKQRQLGSELAKKVKDLPGGELLASIIREADFIT